MGTSKSFSTPSGGSWTPLKNNITTHLSGDASVTPDAIVGGTIRALGGLGISSATSSIAGRSGGGGSGRGGGGGGGGGRQSTGRTGVGRAASGLGAFAGAFRQGGLDGALNSLGLSELQGKPAAEVISTIADHLAEGTDGLEQEILIDALKDALVEVAALEQGGEYKDLEAALQAFFDKNGIEGLIQAFLTTYVFDRVWLAVENHAQLKAEGSAAATLGIAVGQACRSHVESVITEVKAAGRFDNIDWFGPGGARLGDELVSELEGRLKAL